MATAGQCVGRALQEEIARGSAPSAVRPIPSFQQARILVVDDDWGVRESLTLLLAAAGYKTSAAQHGLEALQRIKTEAPTLLLCDLEMPTMSGLELLCIVRRRFPEIAVIAMSGTYEGDTVPEGVMADAVYTKGANRPPELFQMIAEVIQTSSTRVRSKEPSPIWGRWIRTDRSGTSLVLVTCPDCLRSFPVTMSAAKARLINEVRCAFCRSEIRYITDPHSSDQDLSDIVLSILRHGRAPQRAIPAKTSTLSEFPKYSRSCSKPV